MTCDQAMRLAEKLADGEATAKERDEATAHLGGCDDCRAHYEFVLALESATEAIDWPEPPEAYWQHLPSKVLARIQAEPGSRSSWRMLLGSGVLRFGAVAATLTVVVAVGLTVLRDDPAQLEPSAAQAPPASAVERSSEADLEEAAPAAEPEPEPNVVMDAPGRGSRSPSPPTSAPPPPSSRTSRTVAAPKREDPVASAFERAEQAEPADAVELTASAAFEDDAAEVERTWEVQNPAGLEGAENAPAAQRPREARDNRARLSAAAPSVAEGAGRAQGADAVRSDDAFAASEALQSRASGVAEDPCARWRSYLERFGDEGSDALEARYFVAVCSLDEHDDQPGDETRERALRDVDAYLALEAEGERAERVRERASELRPERNQ